MPDPLTTGDTIALRLSQLGLDLRTDDAPADAPDDCAAEASAWVRLFLGSRFTEADLAANAWVGYAARAFGVYYVCLRRNEPIPSSVQQERDEYQKTLERINSGELQLPGVGQAPSIPRVSNQSVVLDRFPSLRVSRPQSTPPAAPPTRRYDRGADGAVRG